MKTNSYICILKRKRGTPRLKRQEKQLQRKRSESASASAEQASTQETTRCLKAGKRIRFRLRFTL